MVWYNSSMKQSLGRRLAIITAIVVLVVVGGAFALAGSGKKSPAIGKPVTATQKSDKTSAELSKAELYKPGEPVTYASEQAVVNSYYFTQSLSTEYSSPVFATDGTKFLVVNITLTNTTKASYMYSPFELVDQKDRIYEPYDHTIGAIDNYLSAQTLSPSVPKAGVEVYQVPADASAFRIGGYVGSTSALKMVAFTP
jgi:hypothetical protein